MYRGELGREQGRDGDEMVKIQTWLLRMIRGGRLPSKEEDYV